MVLEKAKEFMTGVREEEDCDEETSDSECCLQFIESSKSDKNYYSQEAGYASISPEWEGEYEAYQHILGDINEDVRKCERIVKILSEIGLPYLSNIEEDVWMEYQMEKKNERDIARLEE